MDGATYSRAGLARDLLAQHRRRYAALFAFVAAVAVPFALFAESWIGAGRAWIVEGDVFRAAATNSQLELMRTFALGTLVLAGVSSLAMVAAVVRFVLSPRVREMRVLRQVGASPAQLRRLLIREVLLVAAAGATVGVLVSLPLFAPYVRLQAALGLAPESVEIPVNAAGIAFAWGVLVVVTLAGAARMIRAMSTGREDDASGPRPRRSRLRPVVAIVLAGCVAALALASGESESLPLDAIMLLLIPASAMLAVTALPYLVSGFSWLLTRIPMTGRNPHLLLAVHGFRAVRDRNVPALPAALLLGFLVPLALVMATGQNVSVVENYAGLQATHIARVDAHALAASAASPSGEGAAPMRLAVLDTLSNADDPYGAGSVDAGAVDVALIGSYMPRCRVIEGDFAAVSGPERVATTDSGKHVGDVLHVTMPDHSRRDVTVAAVLGDCGFMTYSVLFDLPSAGLHEDWIGFGLVFYLNEAAGQAAAASFAGAGAAGGSSAAESGDSEEGKVYSLDEWISASLGDTVRSQRQALVMIFLIPAILVLYAVLISASVGRRHEAATCGALDALGFESGDFLATELWRGAINVFFALLLAAVPIGTVYAKAQALAASAGRSAVFDTEVTAIAVAFVIGVLVLAAVVSWRGTRNQLEMSHETK